MSCKICHNRGVITLQKKFLEQQLRQMLNSEEKHDEGTQLYIRKLNIELQELCDILEMDDEEIIEEVECVCEQ